MGKLINWLRFKKHGSETNESTKEQFFTPSPTEALILQMLIDKGKELYGLEMIEESESKLKRGTIYVTLQRMEEKGFIESRQEPRPDGQIGIPRRMYKPTGYGIRVYQAFEMMATQLLGDSL